ncbi:MAG TPA: helix-turn-helix domain-containing protein [Pseudonocardiaceae bacterium]|nr:helix-turn-helix domain-containing protein [Pseudonocardiaceae bacterium]
MGRAPRADAVRNRAKVLEVAAEVFATEGLSVPVHEIARRAGVGTGTVSRHFPTKEDLFTAILLGRMADLIERADALADRDPATAFLEFFTAVVHEGAQHLGLAEALAGNGYDMDAIGAEAGYDVAGRMQRMLAEAQAAGTIRPEITYADVKALMTACLARAGDDLGPIVTVISDGLRA